jgi:hypothetical protein
MDRGLLVKDAVSTVKTIKPFGVPVVLVFPSFAVSEGSGLPG